MSKWRRGRFWVASESRLYRAEGWLSEMFGVDRRAVGGYVVTHLRSGAAGGSYPSRAAAIKAADALALVFPVAWDGSTKLRLSPKKRAACRGIVEQYGGVHPHTLGAATGGRSKPRKALGWKSA